MEKENSGVNCMLTRFIQRDSGFMPCRVSYDPGAFRLKARRRRRRKNRRGRPAKAPQAKPAKPLQPPTPAPKGQPQPPTIASAIANLKFREIGPAIMGGRVDEFAVVESDPKIVYVGLASGGVWKTTNAGTTWEPIFDNEAVSSIGAVALAPSDPSIVWVGTGEANNRQSSSWGNGVYKSTDAGRTWQHMGLAETQHIGRVAIHPTNPDIVYVAALGRLWGPNKERGVYKTTDGGRTWQKVLFINEDTGVVGHRHGPAEPRHALCRGLPAPPHRFRLQRRRPGSAIYKTTDGGATWKKLTKGLPYENENGERRRAASASAMYRRNSEHRLRDRRTRQRRRLPERGQGRDLDEDERHQSAARCTYSQIQDRPQQRPAHLGAGRRRCITREDGGKTFDTTRVRRIHGDYHAMWINPNDSNHMLMGSDGGIHWSWDAGKTWDFVNTIAIGQFYEIGYDMQKPYRISGGLQDNGTLGRSEPDPRPGLRIGITNADWVDVGGQRRLLHPDRPDRPEHRLRRDRRTGIRCAATCGRTSRKSIRPPTRRGRAAYRFQWNTPIVISATTRRSFITARSSSTGRTDRGDTWTKISPDLTTGVDQNSLPTMGRLPDAKMLSRHDGVWNWPCITAISESPLNPNVLWVGTDDGNLQVTRDVGKTWQNVVGRVPGVPKGTYVSRVVASRYAEGTAYVTFDDHRMNDFEVYVFTTTDFGQTCKAISGGHPEEQRRRSMSSASITATRTCSSSAPKTGAYVSFDRGANWMPLKLNLPTVPVDDIAIHPRENDLILGTHGRSIWVLDDITPLEQMSGKVLAGDLHLFDIRPADLLAHRRATDGSTGPGTRFSIAENPPYGALINYYLKTKPEKDEKVMISVEDEAGKKIREIRGRDGRPASTARRGI